MTEDFDDNLDTDVEEYSECQSCHDPLCSCNVDKLEDQEEQLSSRSRGERCPCCCFSTSQDYREYRERQKDFPDDDEYYSEDLSDDIPENNQRYREGMITRDFIDRSVNHGDSFQAFYRYVDENVNKLCDLVVQDMKTNGCNRGRTFRYMISNPALCETISSDGHLAICRGRCEIGAKFFNTDDFDVTFDVEMIDNFQSKMEIVVKVK